MTVELVLLMLNLVLEDGPSIYGGVLSAIDAIHSLKEKGPITLGQIDSVLREHNVDVQKIAETYHVA